MGKKAGHATMRFLTQSRMSSNFTAAHVQTAKTAMQRTAVQLLLLFEKAEYPAFLILPNERFLLQ